VALVLVGFLTVAAQVFLGAAVNPAVLAALMVAAAGVEPTSPTWLVPLGLLFLSGNKHASTNFNT